jgi:hypothetical protein
MTKPDSWKTFIERICEVLWAIALICLPVTTFPLFSSLSGAIVAPLSILPFFILLLIWSLPLLIHKGSIPKESIPLAVYSLAAVVSSAAAFFMDIPGFKGKSIFGQEIRALFTLAIGLTFYLVTTTWIRDDVRLKNTWKYITIGGIFSLLWTLPQIYYILTQADQYPPWLDQLQSWFVVISQSFSPRYGRISGMTYEASWFAHQMVLLYLPIWIAATYHKTSAFSFRILKISIENILLVFGIGAFLLSSPRIGLISLFLMIIYIFFRLNVIIYRRIVSFFSKKDYSGQKASPTYYKFLVRLTTGVLIVSFYLILIAGAVFFISQRDWRMSILVSEPPSVKEIIGILTLDQDTLLNLSHRLIFMERMVYWLNGWNLFTQYPWLGVGLGNAGFFFPKYAPAVGWETIEIRNVLFYLPQLPNVKNLWFRLLSETGLVGFSVFLSWLYVLFQSARFSHHHQDKTKRTFALAGQLALLAFIGEGFSIDTFALPYFWVITGLVVSISMIFRGELTRK